MEIRGNLPDNPGINKRYVPKKQSISETNIKRPPPEKCFKTEQSPKLILQQVGRRVYHVPFRNPRIF